MKKIGFPLLLLGLAFLLATSSAMAGEPAPNPSGLWQWVAPANPDGKIPEITFDLKAQGAKLTGTMNKKTGLTVITNGVVTSDEIKFEVKGKSGKSSTTFSGKVSGNTIKGNLEIEAGGKTFPSDWEVRRVKK